MIWKKTSPKGCSPAFAARMPKLKRGQRYPIPVLTFWQWGGTPPTHAWVFYDTSNTYGKKGWRTCVFWQIGVKLFARLGAAKRAAEKLAKAGA